jgi:hypothetical protein
MKLNSHQFIRSANDWTFKSMLMADVRNLWNYFGVRDVRTIPSEQKIHAVTGSQSNVESIPRCIRGYRTGINEMTGKLCNVIPQIEERKWLQYRQASRSEVRVA